LENQNRQSALVRRALRFGNLLSSFPAAREREPGIFIVNNFLGFPDAQLRI
jgi:hypothetical protein